jgi:thymidylate synthase (FAD)
MAQALGRKSIMKASLIGYTQPSEEFKDDFSNVQDLIAYCARVSNPSNQLNSETGEKLIRYLIKHKHWSPLEMASATLEIETTRDIGRQLLRHRSFNFQEFSQRYADPTSDLSFVVREARLQDQKNRQNSIETSDVELQAWWDAQQKFIIEHVERIYQEAIDRGIAKEQARAILPEGNTVSRLYMGGTLRSWVHYIELRSGNGTQKEHIELARACAEAIAKIFPMINEFVHD